ncbi:MAG: helix-turn-helix transcriptional regulator [Ginsengibacter sp.]
MANLFWGKEAAYIFTKGKRLNSLLYLFIQAPTIFWQHPIFGDTNTFNNKKEKNLKKAIFVKICQVINLQMKSVGELLRQLREGQQELLREVAAGVGIDQALLSKIERGERLPSKAQVIKFAKYFKTEKNELIVAWLSDKLVNELEDEDLAKEALKIAEQKIEGKRTK